MILSRSPRSWLFLAARNYGDALILSRLIEAVLESFPEDRVTVWTRPHLAPLFGTLNRPVEILTSSFPMGSVKDMDLVDLVRMLFRAAALRRRRFDFAFNFTGDVRENLLGALCRPVCNVAPVWDPACSLRVQNRVGAYRWVHHRLRVPAACVNVYQIRAWMASALGCAAGSLERVEQRHRLAERQAAAGLIGLHPFTTSDNKRWPWPAWRQLIGLLLADGLKVRLFCTPAEALILKRELGGLDSAPGVDIRAGTLADFYAGLAEVELVAGLDSFVMHVAYDLGVPAVLINGSFDPRLAAPPGTRVVSNGAHCPRHPCHQFPVCRKVPLPLYACIRSISPVRVLEEIQASRAGSAIPAGQPAVRSYDPPPLTVASS